MHEKQHHLQEKKHLPGEQHQSQQKITTQQLNQHIFS